MSVIVGILTCFVMPASITETGKILNGKAAWLNGKDGWFTEREELVLVNRILRDDPTKGDMNNRQHVNFQGLWKAMRDIDLWPIYVVSSFMPTKAYLSIKICCSLGFLRLSHSNQRQHTFL